MDISCCSALYRDSDTNNWHNLNSNVELCNKIIINLNGFPLISLACLLWISVKKNLLSASIELTEVAGTLLNLEWNMKPSQRREETDHVGCDFSFRIMIWFPIAAVGIFVLRRATSEPSAWLQSRTSWGVGAVLCSRRLRALKTTQGEMLFSCSPHCIGSATPVWQLPLLTRQQTPPPAPHASYIAYITSSCATAPETTARWPAAKHGYTEVGGPPPPQKRKEKCHQLLKFISDAAAFF